jgi:acyl carrier protein
MINDWIIEWVSTNSNVSKSKIVENTNANYFERQWLDSFTFINFITDIEKEFKISFSNEEFQNRDFATIDGLIKIIESKING